MDVERTPVLVVGAGVAGLTAGLLLRQHGVPAVLVERHDSTSQQPKARRFNHRSLEVYRSLGLIEPIRVASQTLATFAGMLTGRTLADATWADIPKGAIAGVLELDDASPVRSILCPQNVLEPVLADAARARGLDLRFGTEVVDLRQDADVVTVVLADRATGTRTTIEADHVIAADGARSGIRERLGIPRSGVGHLADNLDIYFEADLGGLLGERRFNLCSIENPAASGAFVSVNGTDRWLFSTSNEPVDGVRPANYPAERWIDLLRTVIGSPDVDVRIISSTAWESGMYVADRFADGRVFLAGDAAHAMPPMAAAGANTAIQDVHNLVWKLAAVVHGRAGRSLLDTYHGERYELDYATAAFSSQSAGHLGTMLKTITSRTQVISPIVGLFGVQYPSGAFVPDGRGEPPAERLDTQARTGTRIPHLWLHRNGNKLSTLDLAGPGWAVLAGPDGDDWTAAAATLTERTGTHVAGYRIGANNSDTDIRDEDGQWFAATGCGPRDALLVRPDGIVAWRSPAEPMSATEAVSATEPASAAEAFRALAEAFQQVVGLVSVAPR